MWWNNPWSPETRRVLRENRRLLAVLRKSLDEIEELQEDVKYHESQALMGDLRV